MAKSILNTMLYCCLLLCCIIAVCKGSDCIYHTTELRFFDYSRIHKVQGDLGVTYKDFLINFNVCRPIEQDCKKIDSMASIVPFNSNDFDQDCSNMQTFEPFRKFVPWTSKTDEADHLILEFKSDEVCPYAPDGSQKLGTESPEYYTLDVEIKCVESDEPELRPLVTTDSNDPSSNVCHPKILIESQYGCMISKTAAFSLFMDTYYWAFALAFIAFGLYNIWYGAKMFKLTILFFGIFSTVALVFTILFIVFEITKMHQILIWFILGISLSVGTVIGYFMTRIIKIGVCVIGCWTGLVFAIILDSLTFNKLGITFMFYVLIAVLMLTFGYLAYRYYAYVLIISSSILGSYFLLRGVSLVLGGFPNESDLFKSMKYGTSSHYVSIPWTFYLYLVLMLVISIFGIYMQAKRLSKGEKGTKKSPKSKKKKKRVLKVVKKQSVEAATADSAPQENTNVKYQDMEEEAE